MKRTQTADETRVELLRRVRTEGVEVAFETALAVLRDPKAAAPAKATIATTIFRLAGYLKGDGGDDEIDITKMSRVELEHFMRVGEAEAKCLEAKIAESRYRENLQIVEDEPVDVFA